MWWVATRLIFGQLASQEGHWRLVLVELKETVLSSLILNLGVEGFVLVDKNKTLQRLVVRLSEYRFLKRSY